MLVFKRVCVDAWTGFVCLACNALQSALHEYSKFLAGCRNAFNLVNLSLPRFALFALDQVLFVLELVCVGIV